MGLRRIVSPRRWSEMNHVEHPPLMMKQLFQAVCGGLRWIEANEMAVHIATRAAEEGYPCSSTVSHALGVAKTKTSKPSARSRRRKIASMSKPPTLALTSSSSSSSSSSSVPMDALTLTGLPALGAAPSRRLITYDVLDCTLGGGYHTGAVLHNGAPFTRVVALDCDAAARPIARTLAEEFGPDRLRFFLSPFSEAKSMFGERAFDAIMLDPGPSHTQLADPSRGFGCLDVDAELTHDLDMRYGPHHALSALAYLNTVPQHALAHTLAAHRLLTPPQAMRMARAVRRGRPFGNARDVWNCVEAAGHGMPEDGWHTQRSRRKTPMSWNLLTTLRCIVNHEMYELRQGLEQAMLMLRRDGRLIVFTRLPWEEEMVRQTIDAHPHALLCYMEEVPLADVEAHGFTRHTKMWVATRVRESAFALKNATGLTEEMVRESSVRWMSEMYAGQTHGFPAHNLTFESFEPRERRVMERNKRPPPLDFGLDDK